MTQAIIKKWWKENRCFLSIHKAFNFSMYSDLSLFLCFLLLLLCISKFPFYIQRHYRKAFNSSHNVLCIWILTEEMETFFCWLLLFFHSQAKKNFGLALLSLKSVLGKNYVCIMIKQVLPDTPGFRLPTVSWKFVKTKAFSLNIFIAIYDDYLPIFLNWSTSKGTQAID